MNIKKIIKKIPFSRFFYYKTIKIINFSFFVKDYFKFKKLNNKRFKLKIKNIFPQLKDRTLNTSFDLHYIYHPAWAARIIKETQPEKHTDISSTLHFCSIISAFVPVDFYDYRPAKLKLNNLKSFHADLNNLPFPDNSINSLSFMHTIEHIGLGRNGEKINPNGNLNAINELKRVTKKNGNLLIVVPIGKNKLQFNAHRIYSYKNIIENFSDMELKEFSLISDKNKTFIKNATEEQANSEDWGCGCFWFKKI